MFLEVTRSSFEWVLCYAYGKRVSQATAVRASGWNAQNWNLIFFETTAVHLRQVSSSVTDGGQGCAPPPWQTKCKKWVPLLASISLFGILLIFTRFLFSAFFKNILEYFPLISVVSTNESRHLRCPAFCLVKMQGILNRMTNLPRFLCVFNRHMQLSVS